MSKKHLYYTFGWVTAALTAVMVTGYVRKSHLMLHGQ